jgi:hypothetical protein
VDLFVRNFATGHAGRGCQSKRARKGRGGWVSTLGRVSGLRELEGGGLGWTCFDPDFPQVALGKVGCHLRTKQGGGHCLSLS